MSRSFRTRCSVRASTPSSGSARGDYVAAEPHAALALALWEQLLGADHPSVALAVNNLAIVLFNLGRTGDARQMLERSLASTRRALGPAHPNVAAILSNLGNIHLTDELDAAQGLFEQALKIREASLGPDHPTLAISLLQPRRRRGGARRPWRGPALQ